jgi:hypothetical protein
MGSRDHDKRPILKTKSNAGAQPKCPARGEQEIIAKESPEGENGHRFGVTIRSRTGDIEKTENRGNLGKLRLCEASLTKN